MPVVPAGRLQRWWVNDHVHVAAWFVIAASLLAGYLTCHYRLRADYLRSLPVSEAISGAVHLYQVAENPETGRLELTFEGRPIELDSQRGDAIGIAKIPAVRGLLAEATALLEVYDRRLETYLRELLVSFEPLEGPAGEIEAPLQRFAGRGFEADPGQVVRVHAGSLRLLVDIAPNEGGARRFLRLLGNARVYDLRIPASVSAGTGDPAGLVPDSALPGVREGLRRIQREVEQRRVRLGSQRLDEPTAAQLGSAVCDELAELRAPVDVFFGDAVADVPGCSRLLPGGVQGDPFYARLAQRVLAAVGFFWTFGPWLWLEVVLLTWLGVVTEGLIRLGIRYVGVDPQHRRWEPRETGRTMLKLTYAPAIAMVVIWTLMMTGAIETGGRVWQGGVAAFVPIAFALGLFPNLGFALLERIVRAVFSETSVARPGTNAERLVRTERGTQAVEPGTAPDFAAVRRQIVRHGSAPLRRD